VGHVPAYARELTRIESDPAGHAEAAWQAIHAALASPEPGETDWLAPAVFVAGETLNPRGD
jgi:hypothetical protein